MLVYLPTLSQFNLLSLSFRFTILPSHMSITAQHPADVGPLLKLELQYCGGSVYLESLVAGLEIPHVENLDIHLLRFTICLLSCPVAKIAASKCVISRLLFRVEPRGFEPQKWRKSTLSTVWRAR